ncbi:MAG: hypothetical protein JXI43_10635 [Tissierellales bacterium]|nr:hypothetical protein [Tissierellales bacterium]
MSDNFCLPNDSETYVDTIYRRCKALINVGIWEGLDVFRLETWINNFKTPKERYFASCVLDSLIYRPEKQTVSMMFQLLERELADLIRLDPPKKNTCINWYLGLKSNIDHQIRVVPILPSRSMTKSGSVIARLYRRKLQIKDKWIINPSSIASEMKQGVNCFLFIDDFLGTGVQFHTEFMPMYQLQNLPNDVYVVYAALAAHVEGIRYLKSQHPNLRIIAADVLDETHDLFSEKSNCFSGQCTAVAAKEFYYSLLERNNFPQDLFEKRRGFGCLGLAYFFNHAIPDNCLPILWLKTDMWEPLQER